MSEDSVILFIIETGVIHLGWGTWTANELGTCNQRLVTGRSKWACSFHNRRTVRQTMAAAVLASPRHRVHNHHSWSTPHRRGIRSDLSSSPIARNWWRSESCGSSWIAYKDRIEDRTWVPLYDVEQRRGVWRDMSANRYNRYYHSELVPSCLKPSIVYWWTTPHRQEQRWLACRWRGEKTARREWSHTDRTPTKCQHRLTRSCWLSCCESRRFGVDWWESDPNCPSQNSIGIAKYVLRYKGVNSSSILVMHMNRNADHTIPPLGDFIGEKDTRLSVPWETSETSYAGSFGLLSVPFHGCRVRDDSYGFSQKNVTSWGGGRNTV